MNDLEIKQLLIGDRIKFPPYEIIWDVVQIVERGVVIEILTRQGYAHGHKHIEEWLVLKDAIKL